MQRREWAFALSAVLGVAAIAAHSFVLPTHAIEVFDPMNYSQTLSTALNAVKQTWAQYEQLRRQYEQIQQAARQLQAIDPSTASRVLARIPSDADLHALESATTATADLAGSLQSVQRNFARRLDEARLADKTWSDYDRLFNAQLQRRDEAAMARVAAEKAAQTQVARDFETARELGARVAGTAGTHEAQQLMNLQLNQLLRQHALLNQQLAKFIGGHEAEKIQADSEEAVRVKAAADRDRERRLTSNEADHAVLDAWLARVRDRMYSSTGQP